MNLDYFRKINNGYKASSKQETELYLINRNEERWLYDNVDYHRVLRNGEDFDILIIKGTADANKKIKSLKAMPFNLGDYINWNNKIWLVTSVDSDDKVHCSGTMSLCTYQIHWYKENGTVVSRWGYMEDYQRYDEGFESNGAVTVPSGQLGFTVPVDDETRYLSRDMRFVIDLTTESDYKNGMIPDVYRLSNRKVLLNNYQYFNRGGVMTLTMTFDSFNAETDHYIDLGNGEYGWVCGMAKDADINKPDPETEVLYSISGDEFAYAGFEYTWTAMFENRDKTPASVIGWEWNVVADFDTLYDVQGNDIIMTVGKEHVGETVTLQVLYNGDVMVEKKIPVKGLC